MDDPRPIIARAKDDIRSLHMVCLHVASNPDKCVGCAFDAANKALDNLCSLLEHEAAISMHIRRQPY